MKVVQGVKYYSIGEVGKQIGRSPLTIKHWYEWKETEPDTDKVLPPVYRNFDKKGTRHFKESDIEVLIVFMESIVYGDMSEYNAELWGERGQLILERGNQRVPKH